jgi:DNA-binding MarR family transcriptional regulator
MATEPRLRIMRLLLSAHPDGLLGGEIQSELRIPNSTLSPHLEKLKNEELVKARIRAYLHRLVLRPPPLVSRPTVGGRGEAV